MCKLLTLLLRLKLWVKSQYMLWHEVMPRQDSNNWRPLQNTNISQWILLFVWASNIFWWELLKDWQRDKRCKVHLKVTRSHHKMHVCVFYCSSFYSQLFNSFLKIGKLRYCMKFEIPKAKRSIRKTTFTHLLHVPHAIFTKIGDSFVFKLIKVVPCIKKTHIYGV